MDSRKLGAEHVMYNRSVVKTSYDKRNKLEPLVRKGMESIKDSMDSNVEEGSCDEEQCL